MESPYADYDDDGDNDLDMPGDVGGYHDPAADNLHPLPGRADEKARHHRDEMPKEDEDRADGHKQRRSPC